jgi:hypothetical protein
MLRKMHAKIVRNAGNVKLINHVLSSSESLPFLFLKIPVLIALDNRWKNKKQKSCKVKTRNKSRDKWKNEG